MSVYGPTSIMRNRFDEITEWRCSGDTWADVRVKLGLPWAGWDRLSGLWHAELERRSPDLAHAHRWTRNCQSEIVVLRAKGRTWEEILSEIPFDYYPEGVPPIEVIDAAHAWHMRHQVAVFARVDAYFASIGEVSPRHMKNLHTEVAAEPPVVNILARLEQVSDELTHILADISGS
ncbi:MAG: hypothetical protein ACYCU8_13555 [Ferrimicrobium acidiphilum]